MVCENALAWKQGNYSLGSWTNEFGLFLDVDFIVRLSNDVMQRHYNSLGTSNSFSKTDNFQGLRGRLILGRQYEFGKYGKGLNLPLLVFIPLRNAVAELAESVPCWSTVYVLARADHGNTSQLRTFSSPVFPFCCPSRIRVAVMVVIPIPSPRNKIALLAVLVFGFNLRLSSTSFTPALYHSLLSWFRKMSPLTPGKMKRHGHW